MNETAKPIAISVQPTPPAPAISSSCLSASSRVEAPIIVAIAPNEEGALTASLQLGEMDPMWIEVVINEGRFAGNDEAVIGLVQGQLVPQLLSTLTDSASFTLPSIDLGSMTSAVPAGTVINIDVRDISRDNGYLTVEGAFTQ